MLTNETLEQYAIKIADAGLECNAIILSPLEPFLWASGTRNPIYNNNRKLLGRYKNRMLVTNAALKITANNGWDDTAKEIVICATSLSGIGPAVSFVDALNKQGKRAKLVILYKGDLYGYNYYETYQDRDFEELNVENLTSIASTAPWAIPIGVRIANTHQLPVMYIREKQKDHGTKDRIEGMRHENERVLLVKAGDAMDDELPALFEAENIIQQDVEWVDARSWQKISHLNGIEVIVFEDLISTGGSALKEVRACRQAGAIVLGVVCIFNYGLEAAEQEFAKENCPVYSMLTYPQLLEVMKAKNAFSAPEFELLDSWYKTQKTWGNDNGFPAEVKVH